MKTDEMRFLIAKYNLNDWAEFLRTPRNVIKLDYATEKLYEALGKQKALFLRRENEIVARGQVDDARWQVHGLPGVDAYTVLAFVKTGIEWDITQDIWIIRNEGFEARAVREGVDYDDNEEMIKAARVPLGMLCIAEEYLKEQLAS